METATWKWDESFLPAKWVVATYDSTLGIYTVKPAAPPPNNQIEPWVDSSQKHFAVWVLFESERDGMLLNHLYLYLYIWICKYCSLNKHGQTKTMLSSDIKGCLKTNIHGIHHHLRRITTFDKCLLSRGKKTNRKSMKGRSLCHHHPSHWTMDSFAPAHQPKQMEEPPPGGWDTRVLGSRRAMLA